MHKKVDTNTQMVILESIVSLGITLSAFSSELMGQFDILFHGSGALARASLELEQQESGYITPILHANTSTEYQR